MSRSRHRCLDSMRRFAPRTLRLPHHLPPCLLSFRDYFGEGHSLWTVSLEVDPVFLWRPSSRISRRVYRDARCARYAELGRQRPLLSSGEGTRPYLPVASSAQLRFPQGRPHPHAGSHAAYLANPKLWLHRSSAAVASRDVVVSITSRPSRPCIPNCHRMVRVAGNLRSRMQRAHFLPII